MMDGNNKSLAGVEEEIIARASAGMQALPMLDVIFGRMTTGLNGAFKAQSAVLVEATVDPVQYTTWSGAVGSLDEYAVCGICEADPWGGTVITALDPAFFFAIIETQMGGVPVPQKHPNRPPSLIERRLGQRLINTINAEMADKFARLVDVKFKLDVIEAKKQVASLQSGNSPCAMVRFNATIGECTGSLVMIFPMTTLEPAQTVLSKMFLGEKLGGDGPWRESLMGRIQGSSVGIEAQLHEIKVGLGEMMEWEPGQTIDLGIGSGHEATVMCSGIPIFHGAVGHRRNDTIALRITREEGEEVAQEEEYIDG